MKKNIEEKFTNWFANLANSNGGCAIPNVRVRYISDDKVKVTAAGKLTDKQKQSLLHLENAMNEGLQKSAANRSPIVP